MLINGNILGAGQSKLNKVQYSPHDELGIMIGGILATYLRMQQPQRPINRVV